MPQVMVPRQQRDTCRSLDPSCTRVDADRASLLASAAAACTRGCRLPPLRLLLLLLLLPATLDFRHVFSTAEGAAKPVDAMDNMSAANQCMALGVRPRRSY
jgi:hypothetical protein